MYKRGHLGPWQDAARSTNGYLLKHDVKHGFVKINTRTCTGVVAEFVVGVDNPETCRIDVRVEERV